jgi:hypothetical protein
MFGFSGFNVEHALLGSEFKTAGQPGFTAAWKKDCGGKTLTDVTEDVKTILKLADRG